MKASKSYSPEVSERAVRMIFEHEGDHCLPVGGDRPDCRLSALGDHPIELARYASTAQREVGDDAHTAPIVVVDHGQHPQPAAVVELVRDAFHRPALIARLR